MKTGKFAWLVVSGLGLAGLLGGGIWASGPAPVLGGGDHCVAYRVMKGMFYVSDVAVVGRNCGINARMVPAASGRLKLTVRIPIRGFKSGNGRRDREVARILEVEKREALLFESREYSRAEIQAAIGGDSFLIEGRLHIGSRSHAIRLPLRFLNDGNGRAVHGVLQTSFSDFELEPPVIGPGGLIADTAEKLELHFRLQLDRVENMK